MTPPVIIFEETVQAGDPRWATAGVTARRQHYWTTLGYLHTVSNPNPGSGIHRAWPIGEVEVAARMVRLTRAGFALDVAARIARATGPVEIAPAVWVGLGDLEEVAS